MKSKFFCLRWSHIFLCSILFFFSGAHGAESSTSSYQQYDFHKINPLDPASLAFMASGAIEVAPIVTNDVDETFDNFEDLDWLHPSALEHQVLLLGETHYFQHIEHFRNRIFFAINQWDYYPTLVLEGNFSSTPYAEHYLQIKDDTEAQTFMQKRKISGLLQHVRDWNLAHPNKPLHVVYSDIEHGLSCHALFQFLKKADQDFNYEAKRYSYEEFEAVYPNLKERIIKAREKGIVGTIPEADAEYFSAVLDNLRDTYKAYHFRDPDFNEIRQKAIIRNLTDDRFLGKYLKRGKFMLHGGSYHTDTSPNPDGKHYLREGSFFNHTYTPTKGMVYSINVAATEYSLGTMADHVDLSKVENQGDGYSRNIRRMWKAYKEGAITRDESVAMRPVQLHENILGTIAMTRKYAGIRIVSIDWNRVAPLIKALGDPNFQTESIKKNFDCHDTLVFFPESPIQERLYRD